MKAGASDFLEKPCSDRALLGAIEATFETENRVADAIAEPYIATLVRARIEGCNAPDGRRRYQRFFQAAITCAPGALHRAHDGG